MNRDNLDDDAARSEPSHNPEETARRLEAKRFTPDRSVHASDRSDDDADSPEPDTAELAGCLELLQNLWPRPVSEDLAVPRQIGRFELRQVLGIGGFGIVYKALDPTICREVALKIPRLRALSSDKALARFEREARLAGALDHPNIVPIYETGHVGSFSYITQAYCAGPNLGEWLKEEKTPVSVRLIATLVRKLAEAVHYSHTKGVLHRDLKPNNVMLVPVEGGLQSGGHELPFVPRLTDFGIAKLFGDNFQDSVSANETTVLGTLAYMPPEQTEKRDRELGPVIDVYGLGTILYELLTGRPPFQGTGVAELLDQVRNNEPIAPRKLRPEIPRDLETICLKCLEKNPLRRFSTARELADELQRYLHDEPIRSRPVTRLERSLRWCRRKPVVAAAIGISATALIAILGLLTFHDRKTSKLNIDLHRALTDAEALRRQAQDDERKTKDNLYISDIHRAAAAWMTEDANAARRLLERHIPKSGEVDRRGFEWWYLFQQTKTPYRVLMDVGSAIYFLCYSPDRRLIASACQDATVRLFDPITGEMTMKIPTGQIEVNGVAFSPDGTELATAGEDGTICFWNLSTGAQRLRVTAWPEGEGRLRPFQLLFTPSGAEIIYCSVHRRELRVIDAKTGEKKRDLYEHYGVGRSLVLDAGGKVFASSDANGLVVLWNLETWERQKPYGYIFPESIGPVVLRADLDFLIFGANSGEVVSTRLSTNGKISEVKDPERVESLALDPQARLLAVGNKGGRISVWNVSPNGELSLTDVPPWTGHQGRLFSLLWSPDGSYLISAGRDGRVLRWDRSTIERSHGKLTAVPHGSRFCGIPKTKSLIVTWRYAENEGTVSIKWDGANKMVPILDRGLAHCIASRDGNFVAGLYERNDVQTELHLFQVQKSNGVISGLLPLKRTVFHSKINSIRFSFDSKSIAVCQPIRGSSEDREELFVLSYSLPSLKELMRSPMPARMMANSTDGQKLILVTQDGLALWNLEENRVVWEVPQADLSVLTLNSDGRFIIIGGSDRLLTVRNSSDGSVQSMLSGHLERIRSIASSPEPKLIATGDDGGTIKLWNIEAGQELIDFGKFGKAIEELEFSEDGLRLAALVDQFGSKYEMLIFDTSDRKD